MNYLLLGVTRGSMYALIALGYTLVYGVLQLINFAHSEVFMSGAFGSFLVVHLLDTGHVLAVADDGVHHEEAAERAGHEHLAVGEVDQLQNAVDERVAEGDERVHRSSGEPEQQIVQEVGQGTCASRVRRPGLRPLAAMRARGSS